LFLFFLFFPVAENDKTTYIALSAFSSTVAMILLIALVLTFYKSYTSDTIFVSVHLHVCAIMGSIK
jgi:hypothetical protein